MGSPRVVTYIYIYTALHAVTVTWNILLRRLEGLAHGSVSILMANISTLPSWNTLLPLVIITPWMTPTSYWKRISSSLARSEKSSKSTRDPLQSPAWTPKYVTGLDQTGSFCNQTGSSFQMYSWTRTGPRRTFNWIGAEQFLFFYLHQNRTETGKSLPGLDQNRKFFRFISRMEPEIFHVYTRTY